VTISDSDKVSLLRDGLAEAQATVRAYDTKAQIVGVGYIFVLGVVFRLGDVIPETSKVDLAYVLVAWGFVILPILLFGFVLYPTRKTAPHLANNASNGVKKILYIDPSEKRTMAELRDALQTANPIDELIYEQLKISELRELKRKRFLRALFAAGICFIVIFSGHVVRVVGSS
jgi:hypothetical protein